MASQSRIRCVTTLRGHTNGARRRRPVKQSVRAIRGAGQLRRRPVALSPRVRVGVARQHAQGVGRVERSVPPDADRAQGLRAAPASSRTVRRSLVDAATGAGPVHRRPPGRPRCVRVFRQHAQGLGRVEMSAHPDAERAHERSAAPASSRHNASIPRRHCDGRRSIASPRCRTAASCPGRGARSRCGTCRAVSASGR